MWGLMSVLLASIAVSGVLLRKPAPKPTASVPKPLAGTWEGVVGNKGKGKVSSSGRLTRQR
jgi:hypothetical protein